MFDFQHSNATAAQGAVAMMKQSVANCFTIGNCFTGRNSPIVSVDAIVSTETIGLFPKWGRQVFRFFVSFATVNF